jgi:hypothetical protein
VKKPAGKTPHHAHTVAKAAKHPHHAKPAPSNADLQKEITHLSEELTTMKHSAHKKAKARKSTKHTTKRQLSPGAGVACCSAEALAATLRLQGLRVTPDDVLDLYFNTARDPDEGASIEATLRAASESGLAGVRPHWFGVVPWCAPAVPWPALPTLCLGSLTAYPGGGDGALILGLHLPGGPHSLAVDPSGTLWSWGELYGPDELAPGPVEEAWAVVWS